MRMMNNIKRLVFFTTFIFSNYCFSAEFIKECKTEIRVLNQTPLYYSINFIKLGNGILANFKEKNGNNFKENGQFFANLSVSTKPYLKNKAELWISQAYYLMNIPGIGEAYKEAMKTIPLEKIVSADVIEINSGMAATAIVSGRTVSGNYLKSFYVSSMTVSPCF